ncbi:MAG: T9SS type A sorting domain-containing protein, partial [Bacteroidetes bacterium]|nr:T9SS type A sorting domain-containing protein [Bacteroidota bacterium]
KEPFSACLTQGVKVGSKLFVYGAVAELNGNSGRYTNKIHIYDESSGQWSIDSLSEARIYTSISTDGNYVVFAGGMNDSAMSNVIDIYHVETREWNTKLLSIARSGISTSYYNGKFYFTGGHLLGLQSSNAIDILNTETWELETIYMPKARGNVHTTVHNNNLFIMGGYVASNTSRSLVVDPKETFNRIDVINLTTKEIASENLYFARALDGMIRTNNALFIIGGLVSGPELCNYYEKYKFETSSILKPKKQASEVSIFPNPASDFITLHGICELSNYCFYNQLGKEISNGILTKEYNKIDCATLEEGIYLIRVGQETHKVVIKH